MSIWHNDQKFDDLSKFSVNLDKHLGIEYLEMGDDFIKSRMPVDERTKQPMGLLHGGASCALAESTASFAAFLSVDMSEKVAVGLSLHANHLKSVTDGYVYAKAMPLHIGRTTSLWNVEITDEDNNMVCRVTFTAMYKDIKK
tara:strand:+ start:2690 stop:3115 length:426 start_codon:yes stop_codon:yes gene_type:complete